ncbi:barttin [Pseudophryne corroboree]|uniref:barttin n=1 Tax=Pseudophryne corroboree TaxID=495146 RepID=UPI0030820BFD
MAEDKTFRYGLIVLGFFLIMIGMFIMSVDKPHVYITFCSMGVFMVCVGITWSICQCYPKITFTPVDMECVPLSEKSHMFTAPPEKSWSTTPYTSSKEAERYETTLPSYEQIHIKVEELGEPMLDQSIPPFPQAMITGHSQPKVQAKVEIHRNSVGKEENGIADAICQSAPLASLKEDTNVTTSDDGRSSASSLTSSDDWQHKDGAAVQLGRLCGDAIDTPQGDAIEMVDAQSCEAVYPGVQQESCKLPNHEDNYSSREQPGKASFMVAPTPDPEEDDLYYGMKDETDNLMPGCESDCEQ